MKRTLTIALFFLTIGLFSQENVCDCVDVGIRMMQSIERGASEETVKKRFEKENKICDQLSQKIGADFEKGMASCKNFPKLIQLMAGGSDLPENPEICACVDIAIQQLNGNPEQRGLGPLGETCDKLSQKLGEEQFGLQMMNCENFGILMELLIGKEE
jgi:hypothetical protein